MGPIAGLVMMALVVGCAPPFGRMKRELDRLALPGDYVLVSEEEAGILPPFFADVPRVHRRYQAPRGFDETCREIRAAGEIFATDPSAFSKRDVPAHSVCSIGFKLSGFPAGITATGPLRPEVAKRRGVPEGRPVYVDVGIRDE